MVSKGFRELVLTGINTALYGVETGEPCLDEIIGAIDALPGDFRIRLGSLEPTVIDADYAMKLLSFKKLCPHMHLSLQSGSDSVLARMNRNYSMADYMRIVSVLRSHDPGYGIKADSITGFPGETDEEFEDTKKAIETIGFIKVHVFKYSKSKGTKAAEMNNQIPAEIKARRSADLIAASENASAGFFKTLEGTIRMALAEEYDANTRLYEGFADNYVKVYMEAASNDSGGMLLNQFVAVRLQTAFKDGMKGRIE